MTSERIIAITPHDPNDVSRWSGTPYSIYRALAENAGSTEVVFVRGALRQFSLIARAVNRTLRRLGIALDCRYSTAYAMLVGTYLTARLKFLGPGTLLFVAGSDELAYVKTHRRIIYISDATFRASAALNPHFRQLPKWLRVQGDRNEARSLSRADFIIYPSNWAAESAKRDYGVASERIFVHPFGPNIPDRLVRYSPKAVNPSDDIDILYISTDWALKNGDLAVEVCRLLGAGGLKVRLTLVGQIPDYAKRFPFVRALGFLRKSSADDLSLMCEVFREAHFLILPTSADATPVVFSEAQAFGVPPIAYEVGGVGGAIVHGETGLLLPPGAPAEQFAKEIRRCVEDPTVYEKLSRGSRQKYLEHANWSNWARLIVDLSGR